jgi:transposase
MAGTFQLLPPEHQESLRLEALQAIMSGEKISHTATRLGVTRQAVHRWIRKFRADGPASLGTRPRGRRKIRPLAPWQEARVADAILSRPPAQPDVPARAWTKKAIADFIEESFGVRLQEWIVSAYLRDWGFASQREVRRAFEGQPAQPQSLHMPSPPAMGTARSPRPLQATGA